MRLQFYPVLLVAALFLASATAPSAQASDRLLTEPCRQVPSRRAPESPRWQAELDRDTAIYIASHLRRFCRRLSRFVEEQGPILDQAGLASKLAAFSDRMRVQALEPIYRTYPDLRRMDLEQDAGAAGKLSRETAVRLRRVLSDLRDEFMKSAAPLVDADTPEEAKSRQEQIIDIVAEIGFAGAPIYKQFPDLRKAEVRKARDKSMARSFQSDAAFRRSAPRAGTVKISPDALAHAREFLAVLEREAGPQDVVVSISWVEESSSKGPNDDAWHRFGPGLILGAYDRQQVPPDVVRTIDGLEIVLSASDRSLLEGKTIDFQNGQLVLQARRQ